MTPSAGARLGPYDVLDRLGAGGMGEVWRARDSRLQREVAVKVLPSELSSDVGRLKRFEKEARAASALNHPNIVTIYDIGQSDSVSYIAMELVDGKTLRELLFGGPLPIKKLLPIATQIAEGLARAHEAGIVHRDLKPENVMVTKDGRVKILDFGLAKLTYTGTGSDEGTNIPTETGTGAGVVLGTVGYMSPEQASGQPLDFRSDQFSFGSILYEMVAGKRAFQKKTGVDTLSAILNDEPEAISTVNSQAPAPLRWIVERCLAKDPEGRYASTLDLARELAVLREHLSEASVAGAAADVSPLRASPRARGALALALLAAIFVGIFGGRALLPVAVEPVSIQQLTFRRAGIWQARFASDGRTVVYAADGNRSNGYRSELYSTRFGVPDPRLLGIQASTLLSVSTSDDLAILVGGFPGRGTLASVALAGGAPRELQENVRSADWHPNGKGLAILRDAEGKTRLEYPIGKVLLQSARLGGGLFSPKGDRIAVVDRGSEDRILTLVDLAGNSKAIRSIPYGFRWSPRGDEIWFNEIRNGVTSIEAVTPSGHTRHLASFPGYFLLQDVSRDGRVLLERLSDQREILFGRSSDATSERNLTWLDFSLPMDISADGETVLFSESGQGGGPNGSVYKRKTDGSPAVRLGEGQAGALSPDGRWALSRVRDSFVLLPTGAGDSRTLSLPGIQIQEMSFFPDSKRMLIRGAEPGRPARLYELDLESGRSRPLPLEGAPIEREQGMDPVVSPNGKALLVVNSDGNHYLFDVEGGAARSVPALSKDLHAIRWCSDGRSVFARTSGDSPVKVYRVDLSSGRRDLWKEFAVPDIGTGILYVVPAPDGNSYVYGYSRSFSELFIAEGLK